MSRPSHELEAWAIAVRGDVLRRIPLPADVDLVIRHGRRYR